MTIRNAIALGALFITSASYAQEISRVDVEHAYQRIAANIGVSAALSVVSEGGTTTSVIGGTRVDLTELRGTLKSLPVASSRQVMDFVLAHEAWHQKQFILYGAGIFEKSGSDSRLYECQADLLSASYVLTQHGTLNTKAFQVLKSLVDAAVLRGVSVHPGSSHPSPGQRRSAVQYGFSGGLLNSGQVTMFRDSMAELGAPVETGEKAPSEQDLAAIARRFVDYPEGMSIEDWSLKTCKQITHHDVQAIASIAVGKAIIDWNKTSDNPVVRYSVPYTNISRRPVRLAVAVQTVMVARNAPEDVPRQVVFAVNPTTLDLSPGATATINGVLPWYADADFYPRLEYQPNSEHSMISAEFTGPELTSGYCVGYLASGLSDLPKGLRAALTKLAGGASNGFREFQLGAGSTFTDSVSYQSSVQIPGSSNTEIEREKSGASSVTASLYRGISEAEALKAYAEYKKALLALCPAMGVKISERVVRGTPRLKIPYSAKTEITLEVFKASTSENYNVSFALNSVNW